MGCGSSVAARQPIGDVQTNLEQAIAPPTGAFDVKSGPTGITYKLKVLYPAKSLIVDFDRDGRVAQAGPIDHSLQLDS